MKLKSTYTTTRTVVDSGTIEASTPEASCIAIGFKNIGTSDVLIGDAYPLLAVPAGTEAPLFSINQPEGHKDMTNYKIDFTTAGVNRLIVLRTLISEC